MKCKKCGAKASVNMRQHKLALCKQHYLEWVPEQTEPFIKKYGMFTHEERILVAVSGGKDSLALWDILHGFLSAIDAETDGHEGAYYTWTAEELDAALPGTDGRLLRAVYGLEGPPPFEGERYVLYLHTPLAEQARAGGLSEAELLQWLEPQRRALLAARSARERPLVDDKVLTDWKGLTIGALARAGTLLREPRYVAAAERGAAFVLQHLVDGGTGTLLHTWREGQARVAAFLDDYAFLVGGLLELAASTGDERWLREAVRLTEEQETRLGDPQAGGDYGAGEDPRLLVRAKPAFDGAVASVNGVAAQNAVELARRTGVPVHRARAEATLDY